MDTKQIFENRMRWLEQMRHAPKTTDCLTAITPTGEQDCCLGAACKALAIPRQTMEISVIHWYYGAEKNYAELPYEGQQALAISHSGHLTKAGMQNAAILTGKSFSSLTRYNDRKYEYDTTLDNMRSLIQWLFCLEYLFGIECFQSHDHT